ncbi:MAG: glycosyltransferase, partial [Actinomycetota bacterium]
INVLRGAGIPVAAGVRSYRMLCVRSTLYRDGAECRDCLGSSVNLPAVRHGCYQGSTLQSLPMAASLRLHRSTFSSIDGLLAVSEYVRDELVANGFDPGRIVVRPNFVDDPGSPIDRRGDGFLFAGRLTGEKGVGAMLDAWRRSEAWRTSTLRVAGSGPLDDLLADAADVGVEALGLLANDELLDLVSDSAVTVVPSLWPEPFGRGVIEAAARARPSIVTSAGGVGSLVEHGVTGWVASPDVDGLEAAFRAALDPDDQHRRGIAARRRFLERYTRESSLRILDETLRRLADDGIDFAAS